MKKNLIKLASLLMGVLMLGASVASVSSAPRGVEAASEVASIENFTSTSGTFGANDVIKYTSYEGGGTSEPQINSGVIRLYQNSSGATGGFIVIEASEGYTITEASITSSMATTTGYVLSNTNETTVKASYVVSNYPLAKDGTYTVSDLSTQYITFGCFGTTSSSRLYVSALSVTYEATISAAVSSVSLSGDFTKKSYTIGGAWDPTGLTMTVSYDDGSNTQITDSTALLKYLTFDPVNVTDTSITEVSVTPSYGGVTGSPLTITGISVLNLTVDTLTASDLKATNTTYTAFSDVKGASGTYYAGQTQNNNGNIGLRTTNSNSGIVSTQSIGYIRQVSVNWASTSGRTIDIYGLTSEKTAYTNATDLYSTNSQGTKLGSIVYGASSDLTITGEYTYVGVRSNSGSLQISSISFYWEKVERSVSSVAIQGDLGTKTYYSNETAWYSSNVSLLVTYSDATSATITSGFDLVFDPASPSAVATFGSVSVQVSTTYEGISASATMSANVLEYVAPTYEYNFTEDISGNLDVDLNGVKWSYSTQGAGKLSTFDSTKGIHFGTTNEPYDLVSFYSDGFAVNNATLINRVDVEASCTATNYGEAIIQVYVNGALVDEDFLEVDSTTFTFNLENPTAGHIEVRLENIASSSSNKAALYLKGIKVYASDNEDMATAIALLNGIEDFNTCNFDSTAYSEWRTTNADDIYLLKTELNNLMVYDFDQTTNYGTSARGTYLSFTDKYNALNAALETSGSALNNMMDNETMIVTLSTIIGTAFILGAAILILRRRELSR